MFLAYDTKDDELIEKLREPFLMGWRAVTRNLLTDTLESAGISVSSPVHPWELATLEWDGLSCEPLLCATEELPDAQGTDAVHGGLSLRSFNELMAAYTECLVKLSPRNRRIWNQTQRRKP